MKEIDKNILRYEYLKNPNKVSKDLKDFQMTVDCFSKSMLNDSILKSMEIFDMLNLFVAMKEFETTLRPIIEKYAVIPSIINMQGLSED